VPRLGPRAEFGLCVVFALVTVASELVRPHADHSVLELLWVGAVAATMFARRSHPVAATCVAAVLLAAVRRSSDAAGIEFLLPIVLGYACGAYAATRPGLLGAAALIVALQVHVGFSEFPNGEIALIVLAPWWVGREVRRRRTTVDELAVRARELEDEEEAFVRLTVERERARIARDLHDIVSHQLAVIVIHAGAGRLAAAGDQEAAAERFSTIHFAGTEALIEADRLTSILQTREGSRARFGDILSHARGTGALVEVAPSDLLLPAEVDEIARHVLQEALTNAMKHAPGAPVRIAVRLADGELSIEVRNTAGTEASTIARTGSGLGLTGMRERLAELDGTLSAGPSDDGGFQLRAAVGVGGPAAAVAHASY
jgi:signal transduction histidine kinase